MHLGPAGQITRAGPSISTPSGGRAQRYHDALRRLDDPQHASSPGVEGVTLLGVELVQIVNPMQPLLPVTDAQLGDMWRRAELRQTGAERPPQIVQRPVRDRLAAV